MKSSSACIAAMLLVLIPVTGAGADEPPAFGETTTVVAVEIAVNVVKDNLPVRGLGPENFEVFERRRPQELSGFEVIDLRLPGEAPQVAGAAELPIAGRRHFLLLFDLSFTRNRSLSLATRAARELVH
ncbi:MAG: hypothetical protein GY856_20025, partial [bacterium]|nr:hypothetical protein [bacterium]